MMQMLPAYTLERLQETDTDLLLPLYFWYCKNANKDGKTPQRARESDIVWRGGKPYRKVTAKAEWASNIF